MIMSSLYTNRRLNLLFYLLMIGKWS